MTAISFVTLDEVKPFLAINYTSGREENAELTAVISAVCEAVERHLRRPVVARTLTAVSDGGATALFLKPHVFEVLSVTENGRLLTESDYALYADSGMLVRRMGANRTVWSAGVQSVTVTYTAGVAQSQDKVPENIKLAAKMAVKFFHKTGSLSFGTQFTDTGTIRSDTFPRQSLWLLDPYRVPIWGVI